MQMLKFKYDVILGQSYELVDRPYTLMDRKNPYSNDKIALSNLITSIVTSKQQQFR